MRWARRPGRCAAHSGSSGVAERTSRKSRIISLSQDTWHAASACAVGTRRSSEACPRWVTSDAGRRRHVHDHAFVSGPRSTLQPMRSSNGGPQAVSYLCRHVRQSFKHHGYMRFASNPNGGRHALGRREHYQAPERLDVPSEAACLRLGPAQHAQQRRRRRTPVLPRSAAAACLPVALSGRQSGSARRPAGPRQPLSLASCCGRMVCLPGAAAVAARGAAHRLPPAARARRREQRRQHGRGRQAGGRGVARERGAEARHGGAARRLDLAQRDEQAFMTAARAGGSAAS